MSTVHDGCYQKKINKFMNYPVINKWIAQIYVIHLLSYINMIIGSGLYFYFIYAWKSGVKPSAKRLAKSKTKPINSVFLWFCISNEGSNNLNAIMPIVTITATIILLGPSFNYLLLTLEQSTPTKITLIKLQDLAMIIKG